MPRSGLLCKSITRWRNPICRQTSTSTLKNRRKSILPYYMAARKNTSRKKRLMKRVKQNKPVPTWVVIRTNRKTRTNPKRRLWRRSDVNVGWWWKMATIEETATRVYTINLGKAWITPEHKRTDRVVNMIREFAERHMKSNEIKLDQDLNRQLWSRGKTNPPRKVRVKMVKEEDGTVTVSLYEDLPSDTSTTIETPATAEKKETDIEAPAETKTATDEQSKEERTTEAASK